MHSKRTIFDIESVMDATATREALEKKVKRPDLAAIQRHKLDGMQKLAKAIGVHCKCPFIIGRKRCRCGASLQELSQRVREMKAGWKRGRKK